MAIRVDTRVPKILLAAPNSWVTGFHFCEIKKSGPDCCRATRECRSNSTNMAAMSPGTTRALSTVTHRKKASTLGWRALRVDSPGAAGLAPGSKASLLPAESARTRDAPGKVPEPLPALRGGQKKSFLR